MPEGPEVRIMSDFIKKNTEHKLFKKMFDVHKENTEHENPIITDFYVYPQSSGKLLTLSFFNDNNHIDIDFFMGMSGNWCWVPTDEWNHVKFTRFRIDSEDDMSLVLYGGYLGPKYKIGGFDTKRGPDPTKEFDKFKLNIVNNLDKKVFQLPIYEALLNQEYFSGIGNYCRSTLIYYLDENPFQKAKDIIIKRPEIIDMCRDIQITSYRLNGGQLKDWKNPNDSNSDDFLKWVFYQKGNHLKDSDNRTFWYDPKWESFRK